MRVDVATVADLDAFLPYRHDAEKLQIDEHAYNRLALQVEIGAAFTARASDGVIVAFGGVFPFGLDQGEAWFYAARRSSLSIVSIVKACRMLMSVAAPICPGGVFACVAPDNRQGARLAALCGFVPMLERVGVLTKWRYVGEGHAAD